MIWGTWVDPNFKVRAIDDEGIVYEFFCFANSESELGRRLEGKNLKVEHVEPYDFSEWKKRAQAATQKAIQAYQEGKKPIKFNAKIWAELKWHLFELFHGKCAYCESKPLPAAYGDVEHFRPKSKVDEDPDHPGYYWLAYDETNLLPSCGPCNQARAKMTHFPVVGAHAREPKGLADEQPLLLNPYNREIDPFQHLEFDATGKARPHGSSRHGEESRVHYHLNRPDLSEARRFAIAQVDRDFLVLTGMLSHPYQTLRDELKIGRREYSAAQVWELDRLLRKHEEEALPVGGLTLAGPTPRGTME
jgi:hypothetical protein